MLGGIALLFGLCSILGVLAFVRKDRDQTLQVQVQLAERDTPLRPVQVPAGATPAADPGAVTVEGPEYLHAGTTSDFTAQLAGGDQVAARWSAEPAGIVSVPAEVTSRASVVALKPGLATLSAVPPEADRGSKRLVVSPASRRDAQGLLFVGGGWGHVVVAIVIATITAALGLVGAITGQTVAVVLGGLIGFVVAKSQSESDSHETGSSKKGSGPAGSP